VQGGLCQNRNGRKIMKIWENSFNTTLLVKGNCIVKNVLLKAFMAAASRNTLSKLFQLRTRRGALGSYFKKRLIAKRSHYCEYGQLETVKHILRDCALHLTERNCLKNFFFPELDL
jgi:hypothetical protein